MKKIVVIFLLVLLSLVPVRAVWAQGEPKSSSETQVFTKARETKKIDELRSLYRNQVEAYRLSEKKFSIAKKNYQQIQTLASLEEAVSSTRTVMQDRLRVMITYLELLNAVLTETNGIELKLKIKTQSELGGMIELLKIQQDNVTLSKDREAVALLADDFAPIADSYQSLVYKTLSLIKIGKLQEVQDKLQIIEADIVKEHQKQEVSELVTSKRQRAYAEVEKEFARTNQDFVQLNEDFVQKDNDSYSRGFYQGVVESLNSVYAKLSRSIDHLKELVKL